MTNRASSRKVLATAETFDSRDCTRSGWIGTLYADGRVAVEYRTRWQGSTDGERWTSEPGFVDLSAVSDDPDTDPEASLAGALAEIEDADASGQQWDMAGSGWRKVRNGWVVR